MRKLSNDCFALPRGVAWTPVSEALTHLEGALAPVAGRERIGLGDARGRILAEPVAALRAHPPYANAAVDGYGFAGDGGALQLLEGRSAPGAGFEGAVPTGTALRILTGAPIPQGVDRIVLQEDVTLKDGRVLFEPGLKAGANIRPAGEDIGQGAPLLKAGRALTPGDLAMLASVGVSALDVHQRLRVAVLSTGNELSDVGGAGRGIFDANRPMLKGLLSAWGMEIVDLGICPDDRAAVTRRLSEGAGAADAIISSGGASAGDEDHISAALKESGQLDVWRIALKPGRPLAMGMWDGTPVFGLPGNPVASFVCALIFVRPSLMRLSGAEWSMPLGVRLEAGFEKRKKPGREEYLRARRRGDKVESFASEGSGRVSGISWADGLVALEHDRGAIEHGDAVRFIPFSEFGL